ncbi:ubiquitin-associated protein 1-like isoform X1 [Scophthalmus maximus]|uniref:UBA domain-containing protein n=1 Tax=Scophthalmus maximus TaxID=52904 RepID=A0A8D3D1N5_SCOMX|nr:ubiquitin-associated protein 1-like isoform X1 [Scophthalmus maximus]
MDGVPLKMPQAVLHNAKEDVRVIPPDYLTILQDTEYEFSLEKWVITGLQSGFISQHLPQLSSSSGLLPSCPPYWMMFSSPQQSRLASRHSSDFWEPNPRQRSHSLNSSILCTRFPISKSEDDRASATWEAQTCVSVTDCSGGECSAGSHQRGQNKAFVPDLLNPPACLSSLPHQRRKNLRQCSLSVLETSTELDPNTDNQAQSLYSLRIPNFKTRNTRESTVTRLPSITNNDTTTFHSPDSCRIPPMTSRPRDLPSSDFDLSAELVSALSPEERELLEVITARGYPLRTAFIALQKTGQQSPDQVFSYLVACDHLCQMGYDMAQVEEALEMFQNCETKVEPFKELQHFLGHIYILRDTQTLLLFFSVSDLKLYNNFFFLRRRSSFTWWVSLMRWGSSRTPSKRCCWSMTTTENGLSRS